MKKLFNLAAVACCGTLISIIPAPRTKSGLSHGAHYYFLSLSKLARDLRNNGILKYVVVDESRINFTDKKNTGKVPTRDSKLVWLNYGSAPEEIHVIVDKTAFAGHRARLGQRRATVLMEMAAERPGMSGTNSNTKPRPA